MKYQRFFGITSVLMLSLIIADTANALDYTWVNTGTGNYSVGSNWDIGSMPGSTDTLRLENGGTCDLEGVTRYVANIGSQKDGSIGTWTNGSFHATGNVFLAQGVCNADILDHNTYLDDTRLWLGGGDLSAPLVMGGTNYVTWSDGTGCVIGHKTYTGDAWVRLDSPTALAQDSTAATGQEISFYNGKIDLNGQSNIQFYRLRTKSANGGSDIYNMDTSNTASVDGMIALIQHNENYNDIGGPGDIILNGALTDYEGSYNAYGGWLKTGTGTVTLNAVNTYQASTRISEGAVVVTSSGDINDLSTIMLEEGSTYTVQFDGTQAMTVGRDVHSQLWRSGITAADETGEGGLIGVALSDTAIAAQDVTMQWRARTASEIADDNLISNVLDMSFSVSAPSGYLLAIQYDESLLVGDEAMLASNGLIYAVCNDTAGWVDAGSNFIGDSDYTALDLSTLSLGDCGVDTANNVAWTFIDHASEFSVTAFSGIVGDANLDSIVNEIDATIMAVNWGKGPGLTWAQGDFNHDGYVNSQDAMLLADNWLSTGPATPSAVPEPSVFAILASGLVGLFVARRKHIDRRGI